MTERNFPSICIWESNGEAAEVDLAQCVLEEKKNREKGELIERDGEKEKKGGKIEEKELWSTHMGERET